MELVDLAEKIRDENAEIKKLEAEISVHYKERNARKRELEIFLGG